VNIKKGVIVGIIYAIIAFIINFISGFILASDYTTTPQLWKPMTDLWYYQIIALNLIEGIIFGLIFSVLYNGIPGKGWKRGFNFGLLLWFVGTVPGMLMTYFTMAVPDSIVLSWTIGGLITLLIGGSILAVVYDKIK
jgi:hypothetical protein